MPSSIHLFLNNASVAASNGSATTTSTEPQAESQPFQQALNQALETHPAASKPVKPNASRPNQALQQAETGKPRAESKTRQSESKQPTHKRHSVASDQRVKPESHEEGIGAISPEVLPPSVLTPDDSLLAAASLPVLVAPVTDTVSETETTASVTISGNGEGSSVVPPPMMLRNDLPTTPLQQELSGAGRLPASGSAGLVDSSVDLPANAALQSPESSIVSKPEAILNGASTAIDAGTGIEGSASSSDASGLTGIPDAQMAAASDASVAVGVNPQTIEAQTDSAFMLSGLVQATANPLSVALPLAAPKSASILSEKAGVASTASGAAKSRKTEASESSVDLKGFSNKLSDLLQANGAELQANGDGDAGNNSSDPSGSAANAALNTTMDMAMSAVPSHGAAPIDGGGTPAAGALPVPSYVSAAQHPVEQVADGAIYSVKNGQRELIIKLNPDNLGEVRINLVSHGANELSARLIASTPESHELLQTQIQSLKASMESQGLHVERISVILAGQPETKSHLDQQHSESSFQNADQQNNTSQQNNHQDSDHNAFAQMQQFQQQQQQQRALSDFYGASPGHKAASGGRSSDAEKEIGAAPEEIRHSGHTAGQVSILA